MNQETALPSVPVLADEEFIALLQGEGLALDEILAVIQDEDQA